MMPDLKEMPFLEHLEELRWRIIKSVIAVVVFMIASVPLSGWFLRILTLPNANLKNPSELIFLKPTGMLMVRMEIALFAGLILAGPIIFYQLWKFIAPGLHENERRFMLPSLFWSTFCFLSGIAFAYFVIIPNILPFLFNMSTDAIAPKININDYLSFILRLILVSGLIFELPVISFLLSRIGLLTSAFMKKYRRYAIVIFFIVSALLTPPDPLSQVLMAFPLILLYEISIWITKIGEGKQNSESN